MERVFMKFAGTIEKIIASDGHASAKRDEYEGCFGFCEILYSRSSQYTKVFAIFHETDWPFHYFKTTPGEVTKDDAGHLILSTPHHSYVFTVDKLYKEKSKS